MLVTLTEDSLIGVAADGSAARAAALSADRAMASSAEVAVRDVAVAEPVYFCLYLGTMELYAWITRMEGWKNNFQYFQ